MTFLQAMILALLQGVSELFPISSLGHTVLIPALFGWRIDRQSESFLAFVVVLHLGTAIALIVFYRREWAALASAFVGSIVRGKMSGSRDEKIAWLLVAGTIPAGVLGVLFQSAVRNLFASPIPVAIFLAINGLVMFAGEALRRRQIAATDVRAVHPLEATPWIDAIKIGVAQSLALLPGISRSGTSIVAGLLVDLNHEDAAKFSFLLATPVIFAAGVLEIPTLFAPGAEAYLNESLVGGVLSAVTAYASVAFLTRYFAHNDLRPFGWYCLVVGIASYVLFATKVIPIR
jgi:undecaprenyl-diphosphatase